MFDWLISVLTSLSSSSSYPPAGSGTSCVRLGGSGTWIGSCWVTRRTLRLWPWCSMTSPGPTCSATSPWTTSPLQGRRPRPEGAEPVGAQRARSSGASLSQEPTAERGWSHSSLASGRRCAAGSFLSSLPADWSRRTTDSWSLGADWLEESAYDQDNLHTEFRDWLAFQRPQYASEYLVWSVTSKLKCFLAALDGHREDAHFQCLLECIHDRSVCVKNGRKRGRVITVYALPITLHHRMFLWFLRRLSPDIVLREKFEPGWRFCRMAWCFI